MIQPGHLLRRAGFRNPGSLFWAVSLGHMTNDLFMGVGPVLLAFIGAQFLHVSAAQIGLAASLRDLVGALSQPFFGWHIDRTGGRLLGAGGIVWVAVLLMLSLAVGLSGQFWLMLVPFTLSALGSGAFHPVGTMYAGEADREHAASNLGYFFFFGQLGLGLGPVVVGVVLDRAAAATGQTVALSSILPIFALMLLVGPPALWMIRTIPNKHHPHRSVPKVLTEAPSTDHTAVARIDIRALLILGALVFLRSVANQGAASFIPVLFARKGWQPSAYGLLTSFFLVGAALSVVVFGWLADRYQRRLVIAATLCLAAPAFFFLPSAEGWLAFTLAFFAGAFIGGSFSITVVIAQGLIPGRKGLASGSILGFMFTSAALGSVLIGILADGPGAMFGSGVTGGIGLPAAFHVMAGLSLVASFLALALPSSAESHEELADEVEAEALATSSR